MLMLVNVAMSAILGVAIGGQAILMMETLGQLFSTLSRLPDRPAGSQHGGDNERNLGEKLRLRSVGSRNICNR